MCDTWQRESKRLKRFSVFSPKENTLQIGKGKLLGWARARVHISHVWEAQGPGGQQLMLRSPRYDGKPLSTLREWEACCRLAGPLTFQEKESCWFLIHRYSSLLGHIKLFIGVCKKKQQVLLKICAKLSLLPDSKARTTAVISWEYCLRFGFDA